MSLFLSIKEEEQTSFRDHYRNNDLFRHWSPILCQLERECGGRDAISLWTCAEQCLNRLKLVSQYRETEIDYILRELLQETDVTTAVTVMCVVLIHLMNAVEKGHEDEPFDNEPICVAIISIMENPPYKSAYKAITDVFFGRKTGFDGKPVVIRPSDPMLATLTLDDMGEEARKKVKGVIDSVSKHTQLLQTYWGEEVFGKWRKVWNDICLDIRLFTLLCKIEPRGNAWGLNEKMVCNVIGMFNSKLKKPAPVSNLNGSLTPEKNRRNYIANISLKSGTDSAFNGKKDLYSSVEAIIAKHLQQA